MSGLQDLSTLAYWSKGSGVVLRKSWDIGQSDHRPRLLVQSMEWHCLYRMASCDKYETYDRNEHHLPLTSCVVHAKNGMPITSQL